MTEQEFLNELVKRAKAYGWMGDYSEITEFIKVQFINAKLPIPDLTPNPLSDDADLR